MLASAVVVYSERRDLAGITDQAQQRAGPSELQIPESTHAPLDYCCVGLGAISHNMRKATMIEMKQRTHRTIGPDAPLNLMPNASNSIGPLVALSKDTMQKAVTADMGVPMHPA